MLIFQTSIYQLFCRIISSNSQFFYITFLQVRNTCNQISLKWLFIYAIIGIHKSSLLTLSFFFLFGFLNFWTAGYVDLPDVFRVGFLMALSNAVIWIVVGSFWWKFLGLFWVLTILGNSSISPAVFSPGDPWYDWEHLIFHVGKSLNLFLLASE